MNILFISQFGQWELRKGPSVVPRIGDKVDLFYSPLPEVTGVIWYPSSERLSAINPKLDDVDVIVTVS